MTCLVAWLFFTHGYCGHVGCGVVCVLLEMEVSFTHRSSVVRRSVPFSLLLLASVGEGNRSKRINEDRCYATTRATNVAIVRGRAFTFLRIFVGFAFKPSAGLCDFLAIFWQPEEPIGISGIDNHILSSRCCSDC